MAYTWIYRRWPAGKRMWFPLLLSELAVLVPLLILFGVQQPDLFRTKFWRIGYENGFNSNPNMVVFAMVNHEPAPHVPFVWSRMLTNFNVAIAVINLFVLLVKMITLIMRACYPIVTLVVNVGLVALWTTSVAGQAGPDYADPQRPSRVPWYLSKSCKYARPWNMVSSCHMAKGTFAVTVLMLFIMLIHLGVSIWAMVPHPRNNKGYYDDGEEEEEVNHYARSSPDHETKYPAVEMQHMRFPPSPQPIFTPRTQTFNTLDGTVPGRRWN